MSRVDQLRQELARLKTAEAGLKDDLAKYERTASGARAEARRKRDAAERTSSAATRRSYERAAEAAEKKCATAEGKAADVSGKLATNARAQSTKSRTLREAEKSEQRATDQADRRRRREEINHAHQVAALAQPSIRYVYVPEPEPERLRVLYLTANPRIARPEEVLRVDAEVRLVREAIKKSPHRDLVMLDARPAATPEDLIDGINEIAPHIVHFSGHGGSGALLFDDGSVVDPHGRHVDFAVLAKTLAATDHPPTVLVMNACDSLDGADVILPAVPVVIAMADTVSDLAATVFATRFYAALGSGQSVGSAFKQGVVGIDLTDPAEADVPRIISRDDADPDELMLVRPAN